MEKIAVRINVSDSVEEMAKKIFKHFEVGQSTTIEGFLRSKDPDAPMIPKGQIVLKKIEELDQFCNMQLAKDNRWRRRRVKPANTIGDYLAHKIFTWEKRMDESSIKYTIWRIQ